jgi:uncharacterized protein
MRPLFTAHWNNLVMLNYEIDPAVLQPYLPSGTACDLWNNKCYLSLVAFRFSHPKIKTVPIPFYTNFVQINLRFYVRRYCNGECRKGVVFIKEIAEGRLLKAGAALLYNERYTNLQTRHCSDENDTMLHIKYEWKLNKEWNYVHATANPYKIIPADDTAEAFITNRFWGYTKISGNQTAEFRVDHAPWKICALESFDINCNSRLLYGEKLHAFLSQKPAFAFMTDGSFVKVYNKKAV